MTNDSEAARIVREYERRAASIPAGFYALDKPANRFAHARLAQRVRELLGALEGRKIADIGCGAGNWLREFLDCGARPEDLFGIDLKLRGHIPGATLVTGDASQLPLPSASIDIACQFTAFSSVLDDGMKRAMALEMLRVLRPNGRILWYDLRVNNPRNSAVRAIPLDEIRRLFPACSIAAESITLAPPIARAVVPRSWGLASFLERIPALRSHNLVLIGKRA